MVHLKIEGHKDHDVPDGSTVWISGGWLRVEVAQLLKTVLVETPAQLSQALGQAPWLAPNVTAAAAPAPVVPWVPPSIPDWLKSQELSGVGRASQPPPPRPVPKGELPKVSFSRGSNSKYQEILAVVWEVMHTGQWYTTGDLTDVVFTMCPAVAGRSRALVVGEVQRLMARLGDQELVEHRPASANSSGGKGAPQKYRRRDR